MHEQILIQSDLAQFVDHDAESRSAALPQKVAQQGRLAAPEKAGDDSERDRIMHVAGLPGSHRSADRSGVRKDPRQTSRRLPGWERAANDLVARPDTRPRRPSPPPRGRSEQRRVGQEWVSQRTLGWSPYH